MEFTQLVVVNYCEEELEVYESRDYGGEGRVSGGGGES